MVCRSRCSPCHCLGQCRVQAHPEDGLDEWNRTWKIRTRSVSLTKLLSLVASLYSFVAFSPGPLPAFRYYMLKSNIEKLGRAWRKAAHSWDGTHGDVG